MAASRVLVPEGMDPRHAQRTLDLLAAHEGALHRIESALANEGAATAPSTAAMLAALDAKWRSIDVDYGVYETHEVATLVGVTNRSSVHRLRETRGLVAYKRANRRLYPAFQFHRGRAVDLRPLTTPLREAGWSDEDIVMWLISANGHTPRNEPPVRALVAAIGHTASGVAEVPERLAELARAAAAPAW